jgi:hypothetical protein
MWWRLGGGAPSLFSREGALLLQVGGANRGTMEGYLLTYCLDEQDHDGTQDDDRSGD